MLAQADGTLPAASVKAIKADKGLHRVIIVGGEDAVSNDVLDQLGNVMQTVRREDRRKATNAMGGSTGGSTGGKSGNVKPRK